MKRSFLHRLAAFALAAPFAWSEPLPSGSVGDSGGASIVAPKPPKKEVTVITYTAVSPARQWSNAEGKTIVGRLLAFSVPAEGTPGPVEVIREGKVRFLLSSTRKPVDYPLAQLSAEDQSFIQNIAKQAAKGLPPKRPPVAEKPAMEKPGAPPLPAP